MCAAASSNRSSKQLKRHKVAIRGRRSGVKMLQTKVLIVSLSALMLSACVVAPYPARPVVYAAPVSAEVEVGAPLAVVDMPPPAPYVEMVPVAPFPGAFWIGGYWGWNGGRHVWVPGRYEHPRPGYTWRAHAWVQQGGHYHLRAGGWVRG
jgi:WXXGXW repeat (2 copies)